MPFSVCDEGTGADRKRYMRTTDCETDQTLTGPVLIVVTEVCIDSATEL